jgi:hypothetical protein
MKLRYHVRLAEAALRLQAGPARYMCSLSSGVQFMTCHPHRLLAAFAAALLAVAPIAHADWAQSSDPLVIQAAPRDWTIQAQNPPGFTWARHPASPASYELEILPAGASVPIRATVQRNWYLPSKAFAQGNYSWRVRPSNSADWSSWRPFSITGRSTVFEVPENASLRARILAKPRPRALPPSFTPYASWNGNKRQDMEAYASRLGNEVKSQITALPALSDATWQLAIVAPLTAAMASQQSDIREKVNEASRQLEAAALMYRLKGETVYLSEAYKKGDQLASLNPRGPTSYTNQDQATRQICLSLMKAIDLLANNIDGTRKARWLNSVTVRANEIYANLAGDNGRLDQYPFDSHGNTSLVFMVLISSLALGDIPDAVKWFDFSFRAYANSPSPWSGPEGGYANGTAYAEYTAGYLVALWDPLSQVTGVNFYAKPWSLGFLDFATQFTPPGSRKHVFGDGSENKPDTRVFRAFASRLVSPRAAWYVKGLGGVEDVLSILQAPYPLPVANTSFTSPPANSGYYPSIGWAAMHSNINAPERTSVYFKSSPYGSFSHSHGDQNSFLLSVAGQPLIIKSGWYDWYGSPMWKDWYHQTKSQNAVTFDGGKGQLVDGYRETLQRNGRITSFSAQPTYDYVEGDAAPSYGGQLGTAKRQLWYLRNQNAVIIRDRIAASAPHSYEFNLHAPVAIVRENAQSVKIAVNGQSVCARSLNPSNWVARSGPAPKAGTVEDHGAFTVQNDGNAPAEFLVVLDVGCKRPAITVAGTTTRTVTVGTQSVNLY